MRIIAGRFGGLRLAALGKGDAGAHLRPTPDRVRESLFSLLVSSCGDPVPDARVLDLFAGSGALGLEALSRGAAHAVFVDSGGLSARLLNENISKTRTTDITQVIKRDATKLGECAGEGFDMIFLDPPYGKGLGLKALTAAHMGGWINHGACIVWEENVPQEPPPGFTLADHRRYGDTKLTILFRDGTDGVD
ncbi:16S rRNA (guanine(966)-N(2))-methyltransferase RsmD [Actibacterium sp. 188UL27-1]|uniref:16S rRNA (guanine(966)-N(2))-methyltransferase RsmD n=1 Tax=Actibacterium sp. 188UL27-1 TaxID=2786961 RepID=UPI00195B9140|nr:16S rRNA (guanine(966)-N(2))-methyltransferase RsmD [Actibacterium sp. 188UL27-1]MBM7066008.1 16S rRNA (guanine(966)-N(2))-methyltransferase RsmD [Actibacterium sp. 188UL27-1]